MNANRRHFERVPEADAAAGKVDCKNAVEALRIAATPLDSALLFAAAKFHGGRVTRALVFE